MSRILIGALSGWQHADRRDRCVQTWFRNAVACDLDPVLLLGLPGIPHPERRGDLLLLPCPDSYDSLPQRTRWFCEWALVTRDDWEYLFKCDDDTYVAAARLAALGTDGRDYIGAEWKPGVAYGSGGGGYLLSRRAAKIVAEHMWQETGAEDQLVGQVLREHGIPLHIDNRFVPFGNNDKRPRADNDTITVHGVEADLFFASHAETSATPSAFTTVHRLGRPWRWPASDKECLVVLDQVSGLGEILKHCTTFRSVVQAGGNMGVYPWALARQFESVYTFEPLEACFQCLAANVTDQNVFKFQAALGNNRSKVQMHVDPANLGAQYVAPQGKLPVMMIDDLALEDCDLIYLDVEGFELPALQGAANTIRASRPTIVVEDKGLHRLHGIPDRGLSGFFDSIGYRLVGRVLNDSIYSAQ